MYRLAGFWAVLTLFVGRMGVLFVRLMGHGTSTLLYYIYGVVTAPVNKNELLESERRARQLVLQ